MSSTKLKSREQARGREGGRNGGGGRGGGGEKGGGRGGEKWEEKGVRVRGGNGGEGGGRGGEGRGRGGGGGEKRGGGEFSVSELTAAGNMQLPAGLRQDREDSGRAGRLSTVESENQGELERCVHTLYVLYVCHTVQCVILYAKYCTCELFYSQSKAI